MTYKQKMTKKFPLLYCLLRKLRAKYWSIIPIEYTLKKKWYKNFGNNLNLTNPKTYNEKLQWLKLNIDNKELACKFADKFAARLLVQEKIGSKYLTKLIACYDSFDQIDFNNLPNNYVLKATHDSGSVLIVKNKIIDLEMLNKIKCNFSINYGHYSQEMVYDNIKPKIIVEEFLNSDDGKNLKDYKVFCFNGKAKLIQIDIDRYEDHKRDFYDLNWNKLYLEIKFKSSNLKVQKPLLLNEMLKLSNLLSLGFKHVRVDWYISNDKLFFGEMTFFHGSGYEKFNDRMWEEKMGSWIEIE